MVNDIKRSRLIHSVQITLNMIKNECKEEGDQFWLLSKRMKRCVKDACKNVVYGRKKTIFLCFLVRLSGLIAA
jgi:hypothetical protein